MDKLYRVLGAVVLLAACQKSERKAGGGGAGGGAGERPALAATAYKFDGIKLGDRFGSQVMNHAPYDAPCDNDPVNRAKTVRAMVYGGLPCRDHAFPERTTVAFLIDMTADRGNYDTPIRALAWMGGSYFDSRSSFPLEPGAPEADAAAKLGAPLATFSIKRHDNELTVRRHPNDVYSLAQGGILVGFVVGAMPPADDPDPAKASDDESWRMLAQLYDRYTPRPKSDPATDAALQAECEKAFDHVLEVMRKDPAHAAAADELAARRDGKLERCFKQSTHEQRVCAAAAADLDAAEACMKRRGP